MKKVTLLSLLCLLFCPKLFASHIQGGDIRYEFNGTNYTVYVTYYRDCYTPIIPPADSIYLYINSSSCGVSRTKFLKYAGSDTLRDMYCPTASIGCSVGVYSTWITISYVDTVDLSSCSDWHLSIDESSYTMAIKNLTAGDMFLEAFLDNSTAINSNAKTLNFRPYYLGNTLNTHSFYTVDPDNDSISMQMITPQTTSGGGIPYNMTYTTGYSSSAPLGTGIAQLNSASQQLALKAPSTTGLYLLSTRVNEYRHGALIGYCTRQWIGEDVLTTLPKDPLDSGSTFVYATRPGETDSVTVHFTDSTATDSVFVDFYPTNGWSYVTTTQAAAGRGSGTIKWTTPSTLDPAVTPYFYINVRAYTHDCPYDAETWYSILVHTTGASDSVWAGDADNDYTVDAYDPLAIAVAYGQTGATRAGATTSWVAQYCAPWSSTFITGSNTNHADCNGDGTVNSSDLAAVTANYSMHHYKTGIGSLEKITGLPPLYFDLSGIKLIPGNAVLIPVKLGNTGFPATMYGVAASVVISGITLITAPTITIPSSAWAGANTLSFTKAINNNRVDFSYAKNDHVMASGAGTIAMLNFTVPATANMGDLITFSFQEAKVIDKDGRDQTNSYSVSGDTIRITTDVPCLCTHDFKLTLSPNPSTSAAQLSFTLKNSSKVHINVMDIAGKVIWEKEADYKTGLQHIAMPSTMLAPGTYLVQIKDVEGTQVVKWIKQ